MKGRWPRGLWCERDRPRLTEDRGRLVFGAHWHLRVGAAGPWGHGMIGRPTRALRQKTVGYSKTTATADYGL